MYQVILERKAHKELQRLGKKEQKRIQRAIDYLAVDPLTGKKMKGEYEGQYTLRVWPYRIIYKIKKKTVTVFVLAIGHRQGIYR